MISKYLTILPAVAVLLLGAGCSNDDMDGVLADGPVAAQVTAAISDGQTVTRVSTDGDTPAFADGDAINVVAGGTDTYEYTLSGSTWSADTPYYFQDLNAVSFRGWYATSTPTDNSISINTAEQTTDGDSGWNEWDILATPEVPAFAASPAINFTGDNAFSHVMSQVTLTFKAGNGVSSLSALSQYALTDLITDADFSTLTCELAAGSTVGDITQTVSAASGTEESSEEAAVTEYTCPSVILVPQSVTDGKLSLEVTYNGLTYTAELILPDSATAMTAGTHYTFNVTLNNTGLTVSSAAITDWTAATGTGSATIQKESGYTFTTDDTGIRTYTVYDEAGLLAWAEYASSNLNTNCTLANDIELTSNWTAVGNSSSRYSGTFDGNGKTITGLTISASNGTYLGLIGCLGSAGVVKNLALAGVSISVTNGSSIGGVVGTNYGSITNCSVSGYVSGYGDTGGVVGTNCGRVTSCSVSDSVSGTYYTGGVVGYNENGNVTACYFTGTVSGYNYTGGVAGWNETTVTACYFAGAVSGTGSYAGGVMGADLGTATACYWTNTGSVSSGIGYPSSKGGTTKVDGTIEAWASAAETMNGYLTDWQYVANEAYDGTDITVAPLLLEAATE